MRTKKIIAAVCIATLLTAPVTFAQDSKQKPPVAGPTANGGWWTGLLDILDLAE